MKTADKPVHSLQIQRVNNGFEIFETNFGRIDADSYDYSRKWVATDIFGLQSVLENILKVPKPCDSCGKSDGPF